MIPVDIFTLESIASYSKSPTGQRMLASLDIEGIDSSLCGNPHLDVGIWDALYLKYENTQRTKLIANATTADQARKILAEPVSYRRAAALRRGVAVMDEDTKNEMIAYAQSEPEADCAAACITSGIADETVAHKFWDRVLLDGAILADVGPISFRDVLEGAVEKYRFIGNEQVIQMAEDGFFSGYLSLSRIIDYRPALVRPLLLSNFHKNFYNELAASRYLTSAQAHRMYLGLLRQREDKQPAHGLEILGSNPCVSRVTRAACLDILVNERGQDEFAERLTAQRAKAAQGIAPLRSAWQLASEAEVLEIKESLHSISSSCYPTLEGFIEKLSPNLDSLNYVDRSYVDSVITPMLDSLGESGWDLFISLAGNWSGGVDELLEVVRSTNR